MPIQQGAVLEYGTSLGTFTLTGAISATSETLTNEVDTAEAKDAFGNTSSKTYYNHRQTYKFEAYLEKVAGVIQPLPVPGQAGTIAVQAGGDTALNGAWIVAESSKKMSNTDYATVSIGLERFPNITPA